MRHLNREYALKSWFSAITMFSELLHINSDIQISSRYQVQKMYIAFILRIRALALVLIFYLLLLVSNLFAWPFYKHLQITLFAIIFNDSCCQYTPGS